MSSLIICAKQEPDGRITADDPGLQLESIPDFPANVAGSDGVIYRIIESEIECNVRLMQLEPVKAYTGGTYDTVKLTRLDAQTVTANVHSLICDAFHGRRRGMQVRHLDGNSHNNHPWNLCHGTARENWEDKIMAGTATFGEKNPKAKLTDEQREEIVRQYSLGRLQTEIAADFGVTQGAVSKICKGKAKRRWSA